MIDVDAKMREADSGVLQFKTPESAHLLLMESQQHMQHLQG